MNCKESVIEQSSNRQVILSILKEILCRFEEQGVAYSLIHGRDVLEGGDVSDIDLAFNRSPIEVVLPILKEMQKENKLLIVHALYYDVPACYYFILAIRTDNGVSYLHLDCLHDDIGINKYLITSSDFINERIKDQGVYKPGNEVEAIYLLIKKAKKHTLNNEAVAHIRALVNTKENDAVKYAEHIVGRRFSEVVEGVLNEKRNIDALAVTELLENALISSRYSRILKTILRPLWQLSRAIKRVLRPSGIFVVILGPDGSGKSTITNLVMDNICDGYRKHRRFHWRPGLLPKLGRSNKAGNNKSEVNVNSAAPDMDFKYGFFVSIVRYMYYLMDFIIGADVQILKQRIATTVVVAERYYYDYFVHPARYAFKLPNWIFRLGFVLVRKPDLLILLDNDPEVIWERKKELTRDEIERQIFSYREQIKQHKNGFLIRTDVPADKVAVNVIWKILEVTNIKNGLGN